MCLVGSSLEGVDCGGGPWPARSSSQWIGARGRALKTRIRERFRLSGAQSGRGAHSRGPDAVRRKSTLRPKSEPQARNIVRIRATSAHVRREISGRSSIAPIISHLLTKWGPEFAEPLRATSWPRLTPLLTTPSVALSHRAFRSTPPERPGRLGNARISSAASLCKLHRVSLERVTGMALLMRIGHIWYGFWRDSLQYAQRDAAALILGFPRRPGLSGGQI